jgi:hypothetical protein
MAERCNNLIGNMGVGTFPTMPIHGEIHGITPEYDNRRVFIDASTGTFTWNSFSVRETKTTRRKTINLNFNN